MPYWGCLSNINLIQVDIMDNSDFWLFMKTTKMKIVGF
jgi:hypothetical protein